MRIVIDLLNFNAAARLGVFPTGTPFRVFGVSCSVHGNCANSQQGYLYYRYLMFGDSHSVSPDRPLTQRSFPVRYPTMSSRFAHTVAMCMPKPGPFGAFAEAQA